MAGCGWQFGLLFRTTILFILIIPIANAQPQSFHYPNFNSTYVKQLNLEGNASSSGSAIQLTVNAMNPNKKFGTVGRVTYPKLINLWDKSSNEVKDFTTNFSFVVSSNKSPYGDGLAFFLASPNLVIISDILLLMGGSLGIGLVDDKINSLSPDYKYVAVEFDTYSNTWDPDGAHVGVNINTMKSEMCEKWSTNITQGEVCNCSIVYNSRSNILNVYYTGYNFHDGHATQVTRQLSHHVDITQILPESVVVGISAATGDYAEEHTLLSWSFSTSTSEVDRVKECWLLSKRMLEGIGIGTGLFFSLFGMIHILLRRLTKGKEEDCISEATSDLKMDHVFVDTGPKKISYHELVTATNNFDETQKLGQGGFGGVYRGYFKDSNTYAAIKRISAGSKQGIKQYTAEVKIISQLRHRNLVKLTGWFHKKKDLILVYEYMKNGSLDHHLFRGEIILLWKVRYKIALGLASALLYLQEEWEKCVLHRDIKSSNIMLDSNFNPKLGDFGLARLVDHEKGSPTTDVAGTMGYLAPEYMNTGKARKESDIFSFGVVLLEIATGRKAIHHKDMEGEVSLVEWVWELYGLSNVLATADPNLCGEFDVQQMECLLVVGLWCANPDSASRPSIRQVINVLNFEAPLPILPQQIPMQDFLCPMTNELFLTVSSSSKATS